MSTMPDLSILRDFSAPTPAVTTGPLPKVHPNSRYRGPAAVLAFDQTLGNCGWVHVQTTSDLQHGLCVVAHGVIKPRADLNLRSNLDALIAFEELVQAIVEMVDGLNISQSFRDRMEWLHETPPNAGKVPGSGISSMLGAAAVRAAAGRYGKTVRAYGAQTVKKAVTGSARAEKTEVRVAIDALPLLGDGKRPGNEHTREALGIAATHLVTP